MLQKNKPTKINEKVILKYLLNTENPVLLSDLSKQLNCSSAQLEQYLNSLSQNGLVLTSRYEYHDEEKYSSKRGQTVYSAPPIAREYLAEKKHNFLTFVCTVIAATMATLTLIATILIPLLG